MSVDDDIRTSLEQLVEPVEDPDAVVMEIERRATRQRRRKTSARLLVAAAALTVLGVAGAMISTSGSDSDHLTAGPGPTAGSEEGDLPTVSISGTALGPLQVSTSDLRPSEAGWKEHTVTIRNTGAVTVHVEDVRRGEFVGDRELLVATEGCAYGFSPGEPVQPSCFMDHRPVTIEPGAESTIDVTLWRGLAGMNSLTSDSYVHRIPVRYSASQPYEPGDEHGTEGEIILTYEQLPPSGSSVLAVPARGARADRLDDGTPVWVVRHDDGTVRVLDAASTHTPFGAGTLVGWCDEFGGFEDPATGSAFDESGRKRAGPAPTGLRTYPVSLRDDGVTVTEPAMVQHDPAEGGVRGHCLAGGEPGSLLLHSITDDPGVPLEVAVAGPDGEVVLVRGAEILLGRGGPARACEAVEPGPLCRGPMAPELALFDEREWAVLRGDFVARVTGGVLTDIAFVGAYTVEDPRGE